MDDAAPVRTALPANHAEEIRRRVFDEAGFMRLTQVTRHGGQVVRGSLRPISLRGAPHWQLELTVHGRVTVRNLEAAAAAAALTDLLSRTGPREIHLVTASGDLHLRVTRKGHWLESRSQPQARDAEPAPAHDRAKHQPLDAFDSSPLLRVTGLADADGRPRASMRGKLDQVNAFLRQLDAILPERLPADGLNLADMGCGRAYLTLAAACYLSQARGAAVRVRGIDRNAETIATANRMATDLGIADDVRFVAGDIATCTLDVTPHVLLSLHACDTATDAALARGVEWGCDWLLAAPCCQHELHRSLTGGGPLRGLLRHGILRERLADLLTDTFRAQILRILGYRARVVEFVASDATARNLMLTAVSGVRAGQGDAVAEYVALRDFWTVTPELERLLAGRLARWLQAPSAPAAGA